MRLFFQRYLQNKQIQQSILLLIASILVMLFTLAINYFLTKIFDNETFGDYSLIINVFTFSQVVFNFGFFYAISRIMALNDSEIKQRELYAAGLLLVLFLFIVMSICLYFLSGIVSEENRDVKLTILFCLPFGWIFLFNNFNELTLQGNNKIKLLALWRVMPRLFFLAILVLYFFYSELGTLRQILFIYIISYLITITYIILRINPTFSNYRIRINEIILSNKQFGFYVYIGSLMSVGASSLSGILISYFGIDNIEVGYYTIAQQFAIPLSLTPNILGTVAFKKFAKTNEMDKRLSISVYVISTCLLIFIYLLGKPIILLIYGEQYVSAVNLLYLLSLGSILYGISDFYNKFLLSKGCGKELRNASFIVGGTLLTSNFLLIKSLGAKGAAISTIISGVTYLLIMIFYITKDKYKK